MASEFSITHVVVSRAGTIFAALLVATVVAMTGCWTNVPYENPQQSTEKAQAGAESNPEPNPSEREREVPPQADAPIPAESNSPAAKQSERDSVVAEANPSTFRSRDVESAVDDVDDLDDFATPNHSEQFLPMVNVIHTDREDIFAGVASLRNAGARPASATQVRKPADDVPDESDETAATAELTVLDTDAIESAGPLDLHDPVPNPFDDLPDVDEFPTDNEEPSLPMPFGDADAAEPADDLEFLEVAEEPQALTHPNELTGPADRESTSATVDATPAAEDSSPEPIANTRQAAWLLGEALCRAQLAVEFGANSAEAESHLATARRAADALDYELPDLPQRNDDASTDDAPFAVLARINPVGQQVGGALAKSHGREHVALFELAYKSGYLLVLREPRRRDLSSMGQILRAAAERAQLPPRLWQPLMDLLAAEPDHADVDRAVTELHRAVASFLTEPGSN